MATTIQKLDNTKVWVTAIAVTFLMAAFPSVSNAEAWELRTAPETVPGTHEIEAGEIGKAIRISKLQLPHVGRRQKVAVLTNLCIGYILSNELDQAEEYCDRAVERGNGKTVSYNNRGVLRALQGDYEKAVQDFADAGCVNGCSDVIPKDLQRPRAVAMRNFDRAEYQVKAAGMGERDQIAARKE